MNLPTRVGPDCGSPFDYRLGHRDARHDAAELANRYDAYIEDLETALHFAVSGLLVDGLREKHGL